MRIPVLLFCILSFSFLRGQNSENPGPAFLLTAQYALDGYGYRYRASPWVDESNQGNINFMGEAGGGLEIGCELPGLTLRAGLGFRRQSYTVKNGISTLSALLIVPFLFSENSIEGDLARVRYRNTLLVAPTRCDLVLSKNRRGTLRLFFHGGLHHQFAVQREVEVTFSRDLPSDLQQQMTAELSALQRAYQLRLSLGFGCESFFAQRKVGLRVEWTILQPYLFTPNPELISRPVGAGVQLGLTYRLPAQ